MIPNLKRLGKAAMPAFLAVNVGMLLFYAFVTFKLFLYTDAATKSLLAGTILESGSLLPADWYYVNGDIWLFLHHIFLVPLIRLTGIGYQSYALNNAAFYSLYALSVFFYIRGLAISARLKCLMAVMAISSFSYFHASFTFGEIAYISTYLFLFLWMGIVGRVARCPSPAPKRYYAGLFFLIGLFTVHNPQRTFIYNFLPVLLVCAALYLFHPEKRGGYLRLALTALASFILSGVLHYGFIIRDLSIVKGANALAFVDYERMLSHIDIFFVGFTDVFNLVGTANVSPFSPGGILRLASFAFLLLIAHALVKTPREFRREALDGWVALLLLFYYFSVTLFLYIFTQPLAQDVTTFRYFYPAVLLSMVVLVFHLGEGRWPGPVKNAVLVFLVLFLSASNYFWYVHPARGDRKNPHEALGAYLSENGLTYGFATYWHSYVTSIFADNGALVAPILLPEFRPMRWLSSEGWFNRYDGDTTFLILTPAEFDANRREIVRRVGREPVRVDTVGDFRVALFDTNIAYALGGVYPADLATGIDFTVPGRPEFLRRMKGFYPSEPTHRWSEGKRSSLVFREKLPPTFTLRFSGTPFNVAENRILTVVAGEQRREVKLREGHGRYSLAFSGVDTDKLQFIYQKPASPAEVSGSGDTRKLGFAFKTIKIEKEGPSPARGEKE